MAKNKTRYYKQYNYISRYEQFAYYYDDLNNRYYYGLVSNLSNDLPYASYVVQAGDSYDSIAYDKYGSPLFYWIICNFNNIEDSLEDPIPGTILNLPNMNSLRFNK